MQTSEAGYLEVEHTADWALQVWGPDLGNLFIQAAQGMFALSGVALQPAPRRSRHLEITAPDPETLLVSFLSELLFIGEQEELGFDSFEIEVERERLSGTIGGAPIAEHKKEIKAVTFHNLAISQTESGFQVQIVFDV